MSGITSCLELHRVWNYIVSGITLCPEIHCVRNYTHTHSVQSQHTASESALDDVFGSTVAAAGGH